MKKGQLSNLLRRFRLIYLTDWLRFYVQRAQNRKINHDFRKQHPNVKLPPDYLIYESFALNYQKYYTESMETAQWLVDYFRKHTDLKNKRILDWGCGPGRLIRHLPAITGNECEYYGTDYNQKTIKWCSENISGVHFNNNSLEARLSYQDCFFDIIRHLHFHASFRTHAL